MAQGRQLPVSSLLLVHFLFRSAGVLSALSAMVVCTSSDAKVLCEVMLDANMLTDAISKLPWDAFQILSDTKHGLTSSRQARTFSTNFFLREWN
jgi:hypothetical protein